MDGAATLVAPTIGPEGNLYITTGQGPGTSHLHAFDRDGNLLWESVPQASFDDFDSGAVGSAPLIDCDGDVYVGDANQFWAFHSDGSVKWVSPLPLFGFGLVSAVFTPDGLVGGVSTAGQVLFYNRSDGTLAVPLFDLPGGLGPPGPDVPPGLWAGGLMDSLIIEVIFHAFYGFNVEVANTPSVDARTGRIFITGSGSKASEGALYGLDIVDHEVRIAFEAPMVGGSGTSPSIAPDGGLVYAVGGDRVLTAFDAGTGAVVWSAHDITSSAAPAVGPHGTVYVGTGANLTALDGQSGTVLWSRNYDSLAETYLRPRPPSSAFPTGLPVTRTNSVISVSADTLWVALVLGYEFVNADTGTELLQPQMTVLAAVNPADGSLAHVTLLRDTSEGIISIAADGRIYCSHAALLSSIFFYQIDPQLPAFWRSPGPPMAGLTALAPISYAEHVASGLEWVQTLISEALSALPNADYDTVKASISRGGAQLEALAATLSGDIGMELDAVTLNQVRERVSNARDHLQSTVNSIPKEPEMAAVELAAAAAVSGQAHSTLVARSVIDIDIQLDRCPNVLKQRPRSDEIVDVVIIGRPDFDITRLDLGSLTLARSDGIGEVVHPIRALGRVKDVTGPHGANACTCSDAQPDGEPDRILSFSARKLVRVLKLSSVGVDTSIPLTLRGLLIDGSVFRGEDCMTIATARSGRDGNPHSEP
ncbi:MAG: PQQ-binding-like beta-propeller repeat protein [Planctomycetes bacterium]|nr:PQQ-binding-like beta-propeller repeat protein [Planctomycetota bacterium]MBI3834148.1 PQQ-binding-like beta-propeller repeat protein [Planctomycetota bacterium]